MIGHGKPLGLGSVKIIVTEIYERTMQEKGWRYEIEDVTQTRLKQCSSAPETLDPESVEELMIMNDLEALRDLTVTYPYISVDETNRSGIGYNNNDIASHKWFSTNTETKQGTGSVQLLPDILSAGDQPLHSYRLKCEKTRQ